MEALFCSSPIGMLKISSRNGRVVSLGVVSVPVKGAASVSTMLKKAKKEIEAYFAGKRKKFSVPLEVCGTEFQKKVWKALLKIPYGKTKTYQQIAAAVRRPRAVRAAANAIGANPLCILVPCHRVIGSDGSLKGYAYGADRKRALLRLEKVLLPGVL